jgi:hypothetical protein
MPPPEATEKELKEYLVAALEDLEATEKELKGWAGFSLSRCCPGRGSN